MGIEEEIAAREKASEEAWNDGILDRVKDPEKGWNASPLHKLGAYLLNVLVRDPQIFNCAYEEEEKIIRIRRKQVQTMPASKKYRFKLAETYVLSGDFKRALAEAAKFLDVSTKTCPTLTERIENAVEKVAGPEEERVRPPRQPLPIDAEVAKIVCAIFNNDVKEAVDIVCSTIHSGKEMPELQFILGDLYEKTGQHLLAKVEHRQAISRRIAERGMPVEFFTESRNRVYRIRWDIFPSGTVYAKEYTDRRSMLDEWNNTLLFRQFIGGSIQQMLSENLDDTATLFFRSAGETTLQSHLNNGVSGSTMRMLKESARLLARIHVFGTEVYRRGLPPKACVSDMNIKDVVEKDGRYFTHKLGETLFGYDLETPAFRISKDAQSKITEGHSLLNDRLASAEREFYKDHNPRNIAIDVLGNPAAIDFESAKLLPCQLDLVSLLEFGADILSERQKRRVIEAYIREKEMILDKRIDRDMFMELYHYARVQRHLEMVGYRSRDYCMIEDIPKKKAEFRRRQHHLAAAVAAIDALAEWECHLPIISSLNTLREGVAEIYDEDLKLNGH
ncbi:hypothetical protein KY359_04415 [Candidatus Woesearchaeota archaeon]|nr:hypothetical protein [Candidatus Woesearchaeota archaeon]